MDRISMHDQDLLLTLVGGLGAALLCGYAASKVGISPIVGYLFAGIAVGSKTPGFQANPEIAGELAELGVILLMFGVGLHFDVKDLMRVRGLAIPGALLQITFSALAGAAIASNHGWPTQQSLVFGLAVAFASTVVVTRLLSATNELQTPVGHVAVGWLIVQDVIAVLTLVILPSLAVSPSGGAEQAGLSQALWIGAAAMFKLALLVFIVTFIGAKVIPKVLQHMAESGSRELFNLTVLVVVLGIALSSSRFFGVSMALGAFLAGVVVGQSDFSLRAATEALPMRDAFEVLFFVSVGMLFDPIVLFNSLPMLIAVLVLVLLITPLTSFVVILLLGHPLRLALRVGTSFGQIGEFSFILASMAKASGSLPDEAMQILVTVSILSISLAPLLQMTAKPLEARLRRFRWVQPLMTMRRPFTLAPAAIDGHDHEEARDVIRTVIIGFGPVGQTVARLLSESGVAPTVIELNHASIGKIRQAGYRAILGDASHIETLHRAGIEKSQSVILSASSINESAEIIRNVRSLNPQIKVITRSAYLRDRAELLRAGCDTVFAGEGEVAMALAEYILRDLGATPEQIDRERLRVRSDLFS
jgi:CPA2 family monovalent cation:H+ antiporter-2